MAASAEGGRIGSIYRVARRVKASHVVPQATGGHGGGILSPGTEGWIVRSRRIVIPVLLTCFLCESCSSPPGTAETAKPTVMAEKPFASGGKIHVELEGGSYAVRPAADEHLRAVAGQLGPGLADIAAERDADVLRQAVASRSGIVNATSILRGGVSVVHFRRLANIRIGADAVNGARADSTRRVALRRDPAGLLRAQAACTPEAPPS
jgi:hypothetical protein